MSLKMIRTYSFTVLIMVLLFSCGGFKGPMYRPLKGSLGYSHTSLCENVFHVRFNGGDYASRAQVFDFCFLRCAELVKEIGYKYFVVLDSEHVTSNHISTDKYVERTPVTADACSKNKNYYTYTNNHGSYTTTTYDTGDYESHESVFVIMALSKEEANEMLSRYKSTVFEADFIIRSIREKHNMLGTMQGEGEKLHDVEHEQQEQVRKSAQ